MKVTFLLSHVPDPRMHRRMMALKDEHSVEVIFCDRQPSVRIPYSVPLGVKDHVIVIPMPQGQWVRRIILLLNFQRQSLRILQRISPDVVHCGNLDMLFVAYNYKRFVDPDVRLVYEIADLHRVVYNTDRDLKSRILRSSFRTLEGRLCAEVSLLVVTSPYFWDRYYCAFMPRDKVIFLPNVPEHGLFSQYDAKPQEDLTIGFIGLIRYPNQIKMLVDASENIDRVRVLLAGSGPSYEEVRNYCAGKDHVLFYGPYDYQKDIAFLYSQIDCVYSVYDTSYDNVRVALPNRLYEAIACELPIIVADNTALAQFVTRHRIGFAVSDGDVLGLRNLIEKMVTQPELLEETRAQMREMKPLYSAEAGYDMLRQSYRRLERQKR